MAEARRLSVVIAERNPLVVTALGDMIKRDCHFELVQSVRSGAAFIEAASADKPAFDVAVIGWRLLDMDGAGVLAELRKRDLDPRVVIFANDHDIGILKQCVRLGARGFCYQFDDPRILLDTMLVVAGGRICIPYIDVTKINDSPLSTLTPRERELLGVLADGWTNLQIATRTGISENTVKYHLKNLYDKLHANNRAMAVALYIKERAAIRM
ncbi:LuxR C-terminal-related transcriptional regulator [Mesorhizobium sp. AR07]|uniref:LuxR C-terminal-related transcriptional regulator n=1 Tax=Mesorhizobium sp. AR07 TaxID=2865838 RepID=UPI0039B6F3B0